MTNINQPNVRSEQIVIKDLPLSVDNNLIENYILNHNVNLTSKIMYSKERSRIGKLSDYKNGDRYAYAIYPVHPVLPVYADIGGFKARIYHDTQKNSCRRCGGLGHNSKDAVCPAYCPEQNVVCFNSKTHPLSNMYGCLIDYQGQRFLSAEHAYQWSKAKQLKMDELAEEIIAEPSAAGAKEKAKSIPKPKLEKWASMKVLVMKEILECKMTSCNAFYNALMETNNATLVESTSDLFWGCGMQHSMAATTHPRYYKGANRLGALLEELRADEAKCLQEVYQGRLDAVESSEDTTASVYTQEQQPVASRQQVPVASTNLSTPDQQPARSDGQDLQQVANSMQIPANGDVNKPITPLRRFQTARCNSLPGPVDGSLAVPIDKFLDSMKRKAATTLLSPKTKNKRSVNKEKKSPRKSPGKDNKNEMNTDMDMNVAAERTKKTTEENDGKDNIT